MLIEYINIAGIPFLERKLPSHPILYGFASKLVSL